MKIGNPLIAVLLSTASIISVPAFAGDVYVIANSAITVSGAEIQDIFLGEKLVASGVKLVPVDNASIQKDFLARVIKVEPAKYITIWMKKGFRDGLNQPALKSSDAAVISAVKSTPGGVGYVASEPAGVKIIEKY